MGLGDGFRSYRGGEGRKTSALRVVRLESRALGYGIAHGVEHSLDALSEHPSVVLGCAEVSGVSGLGTAGRCQ